MIPIIEAQIRQMVALVCDISNSRWAPFFFWGGGGVSVLGC